ncbi:serine/threonine-protein phosphatase [Allokutzneria sp. A3M-2-11 16]|uniref:PP2C family protein-serine/threonine phosphatase n=1 Tax=Allokutzneria sp. A3M-2-11 16 TaxID=2962043 RepID=UPI0020B8C1C3|nr:PP2C family protein-serine/threonine phosphatase [Allokutzneria sp. A3M-2-11 16]MCP3804335.1 serine/threonine-protein phosphatase [Allokutzneria sp. A3M-2-11 16]
MPPDAVWFQALNEIINASHLATADDLVPILDSACARLGIRLRLYLTDLPQRELRPIRAGDSLTVDGTVAGRAFRLTEILPGHDTHGAGVLWVPVLDGTERLGVVAMRLPADADPDDPSLRERCWTLAGLMGHLIVAKLPYGDLFHRVRRTAPLTVASELLWQLLPPQTFACQELVVAAMMERYDQVGGDGYDYAVNDKCAYLAMFDSTGHDLAAGLITTSVLAATRNARRAGADLLGIAAAADNVLSEHHPTAGFTTAVLAELDLSTGALSYLLAGHPPPVLLRGGSVIKTLGAAPRLPLGLRRLRPDSAISGAGVEHLEPGDRLLLHTDGVTEARDQNGVEFGIDRLVDLTERHEAAGLPAPETLRRITHAVLDHQNGRLQDDATLMLVEWSTEAARSLLPEVAG